MQGLPWGAAKGMAMLKAKIHSFESFGSADGPGVRFIVFLSGCPLRCAYCHNPDTWAKPPDMEMSADEVLAKALRCREYWGEKGGITVSGGEPLLQMDFLLELFAKAKAEGVTTCIDTSGATFTREEGWLRKFDDLMALTDTVLLDIKHIDDGAHKKLTGRTNANILDCARHLSDLGTKVWIRHVLVPGINSSEDTLRRTADFIGTLKNVERVDVLPYHTLGLFKWQNLGLKYALESTPTPTAEEMALARSILASGR